jgi:hypothetical protein
MLNIFKLKKKDLKVNTIETKDKGDFIGITRHYIPANKEWFNSIYSYNKNNNKLLSTLDNYTIKLIRSYFNMYSRILENKIKSRPRRFRTWMRILSSRKIVVSKPELKHTNDKIIITLYIFNRQKNYFISKINRIVRLNTLRIYLFKGKAVNKFRIKFILLSRVYKKMFDNILKEKNLLIKRLNLNKLIFSNYENNFLKIFIKLYLKKEVFALYFKQIIFLNRYKFKYTYLIPLKKLLEKFYNKKVEFNLVSLKYFYLNSDIFSQIVRFKIKNRKNKVLRVLKSSLRKVKTPIFNEKLIIREPTKLIGVQNIIINDLNKSNILNDKLNNILNGYFNKNNVDTPENIEENVLSSIKYKNISGIRVQASGRITRRITAARAVLKFRYVGTLKNIDSSYKGLSSTVIRGNQKSNLQYTISKSKTRIGAFGLKSWVSGY